MGRLQRKKATESKKKTVDRRVAAAPDSPSGAAAAAPAPAPAFKAARRTPAAPVKRPAAAVDPNIFAKSMQFLREVKVELKKVAWPTRKQTLGSTAVVIVLVLIIAVFLGIVDVGLAALIRIVLH